MVASGEAAAGDFSRGQWIVEAARDRLRRVPYPAVQRLECHCDHGVLALRGRLPSYYHKQLAQEALADLKQVIQIANEVQVV